MRQKFRFKCISLRGKIVYVNKVYDCPDFKEKTGRTFEGIALRNLSVSEQLKDWMDEQDKSDLIDEYDLDSIIDYEVCKPKKKTNALITAQVPEHMSADFMYVANQISHLLKGKSKQEQVDIVLSHLKLSYRAVTQVLNNLNDKINGLDEATLLTQ